MSKTILGLFILSIFLISGCGSCKDFDDLGVFERMMVIETAIREKCEGFEIKYLDYTSGEYSSLFFEDSPKVEEYCKNITWFEKCYLEYDGIKPQVVELRCLNTKEILDEVWGDCY